MGKGISFSNFGNSENLRFLILLAITTSPRSCKRVTKTAVFWEVINKTIDELVIEVSTITWGKNESVTEVSITHSQRF